MKSTYNFVPAPEEGNVFKPEWAKDISHDVPFSDGESGEFTIKITAQTPIFIRNGHGKETIDNSFSNHDGKYFIPATSLKGMFRNVLEIMSFSSLNKNLVNNHRYSFRDLTDNSMYLETYDTNRIKGGWLSQEIDGSWKIEECENIYHIHHSEVDKALKTTFRTDYFNTNPTKKTAESKYDKCRGKSLSINFNLARKDEKSKYKAVHDSSSEKKGTIVFTGQSGMRTEKLKEDGTIKGHGKVHEFVFVDAATPNIKIITNDQQKDFKFIYYDHDKNNISKDWQYWKQKLLKGEKVPVFFNEATITSVKHFGLAFMYKLPFKHSIHQMKPLSSYKDDTYSDFASLIFGFSEENSALKGRVMIGHAFANIASEDREKREILGSPKASYYPFYVEQYKNPRTRDYNTYQELASLRGFKRYPIHKEVKEVGYDRIQLANPKLFSTFIPLKSGAEFTTKIRFHNLKKVEIGALISAITFHGTEDRSFHSLGAAKPFGYGRVKVEIENMRDLKYGKDDYLSEFEELMNSKGTWLASDTLKQLFSMARPQTDETDLEYPKIRNPRDFIDYKNAKLKLDGYAPENLNIPSVSEKLKRVEQIKSDGLIITATEIKDLALYLNEYLAANEVFSESDKDKIRESIKSIFKNDKDSKRRLKRSFEDYYWQNGIQKWLGQNEALALFNELTNSKSAI